MEKVALLLTILIFGQASAFLPNFPKSLSNSSLTQYLSQKHPPTRIVGGAVAQEAAFPYQVSIQRYSYKGNESSSEEDTSTSKGSHFCGGSIASSRVIVSAGHCANGQNSDYVRICVGTNHLGETHCSKLHVVEKILIHENYDSDQIDNDISAFILQEPLHFDRTTAPVTLPQPQVDKDDTMCVVTGWGTTEEGGSVSDQLRYVEVPIVSDEYCKECYGSSEITGSMICAGVEKGGKDSCQGDSGGPMVLKGSKTLVGIVSWGYGCARPGYPGVYTKVTRFVSWIQYIIQLYA